MKILVTGGAGFIGSAVVRHLVLERKCSVVVVDKLTYAGDMRTLEPAAGNGLLSFEMVDICDANELERVFRSHRPNKVMHLAAESHVDRSIDGPSEFIKTNIVGSYNMLEASLQYMRSADCEDPLNFRFLHVSTDEVFGDLGSSDCLFDEDTPYNPSSPYSATKASSDHLVRAWGRTYNLPVLVTNCSNNYGPYHYPEKMIPLMILKALKGELLPVYGEGNQVRDWLYVEDHARALAKVVFDGQAGETYTIGGNNEKKNIEVVNLICELLEELHPVKPSGVDTYKQLITHVQDRPGHDLRYAINSTNIKNQLGWVPQESFETGLRKTVDWYLSNEPWWSKIIDGGDPVGRMGLRGWRTK